MNTATYETVYNTPGTVTLCAKHHKSLRNILGLTKTHDMSPDDWGSECECCDDPALEALYLEEHARQVALEEAQTDDPEWCALRESWEYYSQRQAS